MPGRLFSKEACPVIIEATTKGPEMTQQQKESVEFYVPYL